MGGDKSEPAHRIASNVLLASMRSGKPPVWIGKETKPSTPGDDIRPRFYLVECGQAGQPVCGAYTIAKVYVYGSQDSPTYPVVIDWSEVLRARRVYSLGELGGIYYYNGPNCANASSIWHALTEKLAELENDIYEMELATNAVAAYTCDSALSTGGQDLCIDLFISSETAGLIFAGDNRTFDSSAKFNASRAQIYFNPQTCTARAWVNTSRTIGFGPIAPGGPHGPHRLNKVTATSTSAGCVVEWTLHNGYCQGAIPTLLCPAIDGKLTITSNGSGGWTANIAEDRFPSRGLYKWNGSSWTTISEREERWSGDLMNLIKIKETVKISRDESMPDGCNLE